MPHPLETGTIRILCPDGSTAGTGFLVSKRLAVTCAHVVETAESKPGYFLKFQYHLGEKDVCQAEVLKNGWSPDNDVAILILSENPPKCIHPIIMQSSKAMEGRNFEALGYSDDGPVQTRWPQGKIGGLVNVQGYANPLLQVQGKEIDEGLSGSAVVDCTTRRVIGMITGYWDVDRQSNVEQVRFGYAIPIETIWEVFPDLEKDLPSLPKRSPLLEGIHLLPYGYDFRIQNFLTEYLGTPEHPEPFGGREEALSNLDNWLSNDTQRLILAAPAGRGKSALLVRWLDHLITREDLMLVFVPVSVRFRTNLANTFFASLAARLAYLHGKDVPASIETPIVTWKKLVSYYLSQPLADDRTLVVVLDGLDETGDWEPTADLIPLDLPKNVRVVVSARILSGDVDGQTWLNRLGWEHPGKSSIINLEPLDSSGVADVMFHMGCPLDSLSRRVDIVSKLHYLSKGDPLLVNLYVEDLWSRGELASRLQPEDLENIQPGYEGYFDRWWSDQKKLWGKEAPFQKKNVQLVFSLLSGSIGGLTKDDIQALDKDSDLNSLIIEDALEVLNRFVIGIPYERRESEIGYVFSHPKLQDYFWDKLSKKDQLEIETRFIVWCEHTIVELLYGKLEPIETPCYIIQYYGAHLDRVSSRKAEIVSDENYKSLISDTWLKVWEQYDSVKPSPGYLVDLERVHTRFSHLSTPEAVSIVTKVSLCRSSGVSIWSNIPAKVLRLSIQKNLINPVQGFWIMEQIQNDFNRVEALVYIADMIPAEFITKAYIEIPDFKDDFPMARALGALIPFLPENLLNDALDQIQRISLVSLKLGLLSQIAIQYALKEKQTTFEKIIEQLLNDYGVEAEWEFVQHILYSIEKFSPAINNLIKRKINRLQSHYCKSFLLLGLESLENGSPTPKSVDKILGIIRNIENYKDRVIALCRLLRFLPDQSRVQVAKEALGLSKHITNVYIQINLVEYLDDYLPRNVISTYFEELIELLPKDLRQLTSVLSRTARFFDGKKRERVMVDIISLINTTPRDQITEGLFEFLPKVTTKQHKELLEIAQGIPDPSKRSSILAELSTKLIGEEIHLSTLREAWNTTHVINDRKQQVEIFCRLAPNLSNTNLIYAMHRAMIDSSPSEQLLSLEKMIKYLPYKITEEEFDSISHLIYEVLEKPNRPSRSSVITTLCSRADELMLQRHKDNLLKTAEGMKDIREKFYFLCEVAPILSRNEFRFILDNFQKLGKYRFETLIAKLAPYLPEEYTGDILQTINVKAQHDFSIDIRNRNLAMSNIIPHLHKDYLIAALYFTLIPASNELEPFLNRDDFSGLPLSLLFGRLPEDIQEIVLDEILKKVSELDLYRFEAITNLIPHVSDRLKDQLIIDALSAMSSDQIRLLPKYWREEYKRKINKLKPFLTSDINKWILTDGYKINKNFSLRCLHIIVENLQRDLVPDAIKISQIHQDNVLLLKLMLRLPEEQKVTEIEKLLENFTFTDAKSINFLSELAYFLEKYPKEIQEHVLSIIEKSFRNIKKEEYMNIILLDGLFEALCSTQRGMRTALMLTWNYLKPEERNQVFWIVNNILRGIFDDGFGGPIFGAGRLEGTLDNEAEKTINSKTARQALEKLENIEDEELLASILNRIIPKLPLSLHEMALKKIQQLEDEEKKSYCLSNLGRITGSNNRTQIYNTLRSFETAVFQFEGVRNLFPYLSPNEFEEACNFAMEIDDVQLRTQVYWRIAPYLAMWCRAHDIPPKSMKDLWLKFISPSVPLQREVLLSTLEALQPFTLSLIPGYGPSIADKIFKSIVEVTEWWP